MQPWGSKTNHLITPLTNNLLPSSHMDNDAFFSPACWVILCGRSCLLRTLMGKRRKRNRSKTTDDQNECNVLQLELLLSLRPPPPHFPFHPPPFPPPAQGETLIIGHKGWGLILLWQRHLVCCWIGQWWSLFHLPCFYTLQHILTKIIIPSHLWHTFFPVCVSCQSWNCMWTNHLLIALWIFSTQNLIYDL